MSDKEESAMLGLIVGFALLACVLGMIAFYESPIWFRFWFLSWCSVKAAKIISEDVSDCRNKPKAMQEDE